MQKTSNQKLKTESGNKDILWGNLAISSPFPIPFKRASFWKFHTITDIFRWKVVFSHIFEKKYIENLDLERAHIS